MDPPLYCHESWNLVWITSIECAQIPPNRLYVKNKDKRKITYSFVENSKQSNKYTQTTLKCLKFVPFIRKKGQKFLINIILLFVNNS